MAKESAITISRHASEWLAKNNFGAIVKSQLIGDGSTTDCFLLHTESERLVLLKASKHHLVDSFNAEQQGLKLIKSTRTLRTPETYFSSDECLLMEYISAAQQKTEYWQMLGQQLADMHAYTQPQLQYGLDIDNYCGCNRQVNGWFEDGFEFFSQQRLLYQTRLAFDNGLLESPWVIQIESICERLPELIPHQPPSLIHGDLWPGNILVDELGEPALIDPAVYYGWREADIAMTLLFGGLPHEFYVAYEERFNLEAKWRKRVPLYNLYHLLNHLNIYGENYLIQVQETIAKYA